MMCFIQANSEKSRELTEREKNQYVRDILEVKSWGNEVKVKNPYHFNDSSYAVDQWKRAESNESVRESYSWRMLGIGWAGSFVTMIGSMFVCKSTSILAGLMCAIPVLMMASILIHFLFLSPLGQHIESSIMTSCFRLNPLGLYFSQIRYGYHANLINLLECYETKIIPESLKPMLDPLYEEFVKKGDLALSRSKRRIFTQKILAELEK